MDFKMELSLWSTTLTHWGWVMHICLSKLTIIDSDNGLTPGRRQAIIWTNVVILFIRTLGTNFTEILSEIQTFSFTEMLLKMLSGKWRQFCPGLSVLSIWERSYHNLFLSGWEYGPEKSLGSWNQESPHVPIWCLKESKRETAFSYYEVGVSLFIGA